MHGKIITAVAAVLQAAAFTAVAQEPDKMRDAAGAHASPQMLAQAEPSPATRNRTAPEAAMDRTAAMDTQTFVEKAATSSMAEVELAQLALQKSADEEIREFAQHMIRDHGAANAKLKSAAARENVQVPATLDSKHRQVLQQLQALEGEAFDREYRKRMHRDHEEAIALFESASQSPQVAEPVRQFASTTLPTLKEHREMLHEMEGHDTGTTADPETYRETLPREPSERL